VLYNYKDANWRHIPITEVGFLVLMSFNSLLEF
jgi:hypothetical protein